jgi:hypothetical protein
MCGEHLAVPLQNRRRRRGGGKHADPDNGTGLTGHGGMVMPGLGSALDSPGPTIVHFEGRKAQSQ